MNTGDLHLLTGAYVLHALSPEEHAEFERHLPGCPSCSQEIRELAETAGKLASAVAVAPPEALKLQVMARISAERQEPPRAHTMLYGIVTAALVIPGSSGDARRLAMPCAAPR